MSSTCPLHMSPSPQAPVISILNSPSGRALTAPGTKSSMPPSTMQGLIRVDSGDGHGGTAVTPVPEPGALNMGPEQEHVLESGRTRRDPSAPPRGPLSSPPPALFQGRPAAPAQWTACPLRTSAVGWTAGLCRSSAESGDGQGGTAAEGHRGTGHSRGAGRRRGRPTADGLRGPAVHCAGAAGRP